MAKRSTSSARVALRVVEPASDSFSLADLEHEMTTWLADCRLRGFSERTLAGHSQVLARFRWFLAEQNHRRCGESEVTAFLDYLSTAHKSGGRFRQKLLTPLKPGTLLFYFSRLKTFFGWCVKRELLSAHPMRKLSRPRVREDQIQPFTAAEVQAFLVAAKGSRDPVRDEAILLLLYDTGIRASELCAVTIGDVDLTNHRVTVLGKGGKVRHLQIGEEARRALRRLIGEFRDPKDPERGADPEQAIFTGNRGTRAGEALSRNGLRLIVATLGKRAGVTGARCSPHTFRHTFAVNYLINQGPVFSLQMQLGHESLSMTRKYVNLAQADLANHHAMASPADNLFGRRRKK